MVRVDAEALDPAARLLDAELAGTHVSQHEPDQTPFYLGDLGGIGIAAQVVAHAALPDLGTVDAGDALVDPRDAADVQLIQWPDTHLGLEIGHRKGLLGWGEQGRKTHRE